MHSPNSIGEPALKALRKHKKHRRAKRRKKIRPKSVCIGAPDARGADARKPAPSLDGAFSVSVQAGGLAHGALTFCVWQSRVRDWQKGRQWVKNGPLHPWYPAHLARGSVVCWMASCPRYTPVLGAWGRRAAKWSVEGPVWVSEKRARRGVLGFPPYPHCPLSFPLLYRAPSPTMGACASAPEQPGSKLPQLVRVGGSRRSSTPRPCQHPAPLTPHPPSRPPFPPHDPPPRRLSRLAR